jgi:hypothetical protein
MGSAGIILGVVSCLKNRMPVSGWPEAVTARTYTPSGVARSTFTVNVVPTRRLNSTHHLKIREEKKNKLGRVFCSPTRHPLSDHTGAQ